MAEKIVLDLSQFCNDGLKEITVVNLKHEKQKGGRGWRGLFLCHCGREFSALPRAVCSGKQISCGCLRGARHRKMSGGHTSHYLYHTWENMKARCERKSHTSYEHYGARGITVFEEWKNSFAKFANYIDLQLGAKPSGRHTLDRIDNSGNYEPGNLRWADHETQVMNRRISKPELHGGVAPANHVNTRLRLGWDLETAKNTPVRKVKTNA